MSSTLKTIKGSHYVAPFLCNNIGEKQYELTIN
jgi:hypothetical protein